MIVFTYSRTSIGQDVARLIYKVAVFVVLNGGRSWALFGLNKRSCIVSDPCCEGGATSFGHSERALRQLVNWSSSSAAASAAEARYQTYVSTIPCFRQRQRQREIPFQFHIHSITTQTVTQQSERKGRGQNSLPSQRVALTFLYILYIFSIYHLSVSTYYLYINYRFLSNVIVIYTHTYEVIC